MPYESSEEWFRSRNSPATKQDLRELENKIMSAITAWAANDQAGLNAIGGNLNNIVTGIAALDALITQFQNSPGILSVSDQAALDGIQNAVKALVDQSAGIVVTPPGGQTTVGSGTILAQTGNQPVVGNGQPIVNPNNVVGTPQNPMNTMGNTVVSNNPTPLANPVYVTTPGAVPATNIPVNMQPGIPNNVK